MSTAKKITKKGWCWHHFEHLRMLKAIRKDHIPNPLQRRSFQNLIVLEVVSFYKWWKIACCNNNIYINMAFWIYLQCFERFKGTKLSRSVELLYFNRFQKRKNCQMLTNAMDAISWHCYTPHPPQRQWNLNIVDFTEGISYARRTIFRVPC